MLVQIDTFAPDAPPEAPGLRECAGWVPTPRGMRAAPVAADLGYAQLPAAPYGAASLMLLSGVSVLHAATASRIYKLAGAAWTDVSRSAGYAASNPWYFCAFGNDVLAANVANVIQRSTGSTFADISGSPQAEIIEAVGLHVMALNTTVSADQWYSSKLGDDTVWVNSAANNSASGRLLATPGPITAGKALGDRFVTYKNAGVYLGTFQGPPVVWSWDLVPGGFGCVGKFAIAPLKIDGNPAHFVVGPQDMFLFNGNNVQPLGAGLVRRWFYERVNRDFIGSTVVMVDEANTLVHVLFPTQPSAVLDDSLVWNYTTNKWGRGRDYQASVATLFTVPSVTWDNWPAAGLTFETLDATSFDALGVETGSAATPAVFVSQYLRTLTGSPDANTASTFSTGLYGADDAILHVSRVRPRFVTTPGASRCLHRACDAIGAVPSGTQYASLTNSRFDVLRSARWHQDSVEVFGAAEIDALSVTAEEVSLE